MATNQVEKANRFRELHEAPGAFVIANAWDAGSARILAGVGFSRWRRRAVPRPALSAGGTVDHAR